MQVSENQSQNSEYIQTQILLKIKMKIMDTFTSVSLTVIIIKDIIIL